MAAREHNVDLPVSLSGDDVAENSAGRGTVQITTTVDVNAAVAKSIAVCACARAPAIVVRRVDAKEKKKYVNKIK